MGVRPEKELGEKLKGLVEELYLIGDCMEPRDVMFAIKEGAEVGTLI